MIKLHNHAQREREKAENSLQHNFEKQKSDGLKVTEEKDAYILGC